MSDTPDILYNVLFAEHHGEQAASQITLVPGPTALGWPVAVAQLLAGERIDYPNVGGMDRTFKKAPKAKPKAPPILS